MVMLVHIADARRSRAIERSGLAPSRRRRGEAWGVYAMPVLPSFFASHQWLRELKRRGARTMVAIYFRVPDREPVVVGHYNQGHTAMTAARAAGLIMHTSDCRGYELIVPRKIEARAIHAVREVPQVVGWRYFPDAHGRPVCGCAVCVPRGSIKSRRLREAFELSMDPYRSLPRAG